MLRVSDSGLLPLAEARLSTTVPPSPFVDDGPRKFHPGVKPLTVMYGVVKVPTNPTRSSPGVVGVITQLAVLDPDVEEAQVAATSRVLLTNPVYRATKISGEP